MRKVILNATGETASGKTVLLGFIGELLASRGFVIKATPEDEHSLTISGPGEVTIPKQLASGRFMYSAIWSAYGKWSCTHPFSSADELQKHIDRYISRNDYNQNITIIPIPIPEDGPDCLHRELR